MKENNIAINADTVFVRPRNFEAHEYLFVIAKTAVQREISLFTELLRCQLLAMMVLTVLISSQANEMQSQNLEPPA